MKKILSYIIMGILGVTVFTACSDDESYPTPTALDASTLSYEAKAGAVKLKWKIPENANYKYIKVTYTLPESGKECLRLASGRIQPVLFFQLFPVLFVRSDFHGRYCVYVTAMQC